MRRRLTITTEIIAPYRIPVFNALAEHPEIDLHVIFLAETDPTQRQWLVYGFLMKFCPPGGEECVSRVFWLTGV